MSYRTYVEDALDNKSNKRYAIISIILIGVIIAIVAFVIIPKYLPKSPDAILKKIDFSNSDWIGQYVDKSIGLFGNDFYLGTAFSYTPDSNKMVVTYASQKSVDEARNYYLSLPGAKESGRNDEGTMNVTAEVNGQNVKINNYFSSVARVFELDLDLTDTNAEKVISQLEKAFPVDVLTNIPEIQDIVSGEAYGGYVRYQFDNLDEYTYANIPIFSRAYLYNGTQEDFAQIIDAMNEAYPMNKYDETQGTYYYQINEYIVALTNFVTDSNENVVSVGIQKMEGK
jgi:hypothetical protein